MQAQQSNIDSLYKIDDRDDLFKDLALHLSVDRQINLEFPLSFSILKIHKYNQILNSFGNCGAECVSSTLIKRLTNILQEGASIYRLNLDEFGIIFKHQSMDETNQFFKLLVQPIPYKHDFINIELSLGLVDLTTQINKRSEVLRRADIALKLAKSEALNWQYFNHQRDSFAHTDRDMFIELEKAIENNLLHLAGQPIFALDTGKVIMVEILLRWQHIEYGAVNPTKIIELASKNGYLYKVALYVAKQLITFLNENENLYQDIDFALNFNMPQIINATLIQALLTCFDEFGIDKSRFVFEATEVDSCPVSLDNMVSHFKWIKQQGIKIAIDDFGSGYSTLNYVNNLDIDIIKIDRSLVCDIETNTRKLETLVALLQLCHNLGVIIVIEGIENFAQHSLIKNTHISNILVQGYFYAKPSSLKNKAFCNSTYFINS